MSTAVATEARCTPEDLLAMPDGKSYELVDGQLVTTQQVDLLPGVNRFVLNQDPLSAGQHQVRLQVEPDVDTLPENNSAGAVISNPQRAGGAVEKVRGRPGGRFRVTPTHRLLLVFGPGDDGQNVPYVAGQLAEPFTVAELEAKMKELLEPAMAPGHAQ